MNIKILRNDSYRALSRSSGITENELEKRILDKLIECGVFDGRDEDIGKSVKELSFLSGYDPIDLIGIVFPEKSDNLEIGEFLKGIIFWGDSFGEECPYCGCDVDCEIEQEMGAKWEYKKCVNSSCVYDCVEDISGYLLEPKKDFN